MRECLRCTKYVVDTETYTVPVRYCKECGRQFQEVPVEGHPDWCPIEDNPNGLDKFNGGR